jgi:hypothetical protein
MIELDNVTLILIFVLLLIVYILLRRNKTEHFQTSEEAVKTVASIYNKDNLTVTNASITNNANIANKVAIGSDAKDMASWEALRVSNSANEDNAMTIRTKNDPNKDITLINRDGNYRLGFYPGMGDNFGVDRNGHEFIISDDWNPLSVESRNDKDTHIMMRTKNDDAKNAFLINRDGNFRIMLNGQPDGFGVQRDGNVWSRDAFSCKRLCIGKWTISTDETDGNEPLVFSYDNTKKFGISKQGNLVNVSGQQWWHF